MEPRREAVSLAVAGALLGASVGVAVAGGPRSARGEADARLLWMALETRDPATGAHCRRVGRLAALLAPARGVDPAVAEAAGRLHDLGKLAMPDRILRGTGRLSDADYAVVKLHPLRGRALAARAGLAGPLVDGVAGHHERWDGRGYPRGLAGEAIPAVARVVAVADALDAITSGRPYQPARPFEVGMDILVREAGAQFDPVVVDRAVQLQEALGRRIRGWQATPGARRPASGDP